MRRREFIAGVASAAALPIVARAQQALPVIGVLAPFPAATGAPVLSAFRLGLRDAGYIESQNVAMEFRWADNQMDRLPALAADLARRPVTVIFAPGGAATSSVAKTTTTTIPIVFAHGEDPVKTGLVASLGRPDGNVTGVTFFTIELGPKRVDLLRDLAPGVGSVAILAHPKSANLESEASVATVQNAIRIGGQQSVVVHAASPGELAPAFERLVEQRAGALIVISDPMFTGQRNQIAALAARHRLPAIYPLREYATAGGLMSYGASAPEAWRKAGNYVAQIIKGAKPADLPVLQPTRFELVVNLQVARALGLTVPQTLLATADEVID